MMKAYVETIGCTGNKLDSEKIKQLLRENGWVLLDVVDGADIIIFNTCAFDKQNEDLCIRRIQELKQLAGEGTNLIVVGCLPKINLERVKSVFDGEVMGPTEYDKLTTALQMCGSIDNVIEPNTIDCGVCLGTKIEKNIIKKLYQIFFRTLCGYDDYQLCEKFIRVGQGCAGACSYCAIRNARGKNKSKEIAEILSELRQIIRENPGSLIGLFADDIGAWGLDISSTFPRMLREIIGVEGDFKLLIFNFNPKWILKYPVELREVFSSEKVETIIMPLQSASNRVLKEMMREHNIEDAIKFVQDVKEKNRKIKFDTSFMVGFPGENKDDFKKDMEFVSRYGHLFHRMSVGKFDPKPNTIAYNMKDKISPNTAEWRNSVIKLKFMVIKIVNFLIRR